MRQFDHEDQFGDHASESVIFYDEQPHFEIVFASKKDTFEPRSSKTKKPPPKNERNKEERKTTLPNQSMPKMQFPKFDGTSPKVWRDNC